MITPRERHLLLFYLHNLVSEIHYDSQEALAVLSWMKENFEVLELGDDFLLLLEADDPTDEDDETGFSQSTKSGRNRVPSQIMKRSRRVRRHDDIDTSLGTWVNLDKLLHFKADQSRNAFDDVVATNVGKLGELVQLSKVDTSIIEFLLRYHTRPLFESLVNDASSHIRARYRGLSVHDRTIATILGLSQNAYSSRLNRDAPLVRSGLVDLDSDGDIEVLERLKRIAIPSDERMNDVREILFSKSAPGDLEWSDFDHVADARDHVEQLIEGALRKGARGVNVLIYGPPGTGKTEFCKTLASQLGVPLHSVGESEDGRELSRDGRLRELNLAQNLYGNSNNTLLLFDEMEDILDNSLSFNLQSMFGSVGRGRGGGRGSKVYLNRLLEQNPVPTLWTSNSARGTSETVLRRMMFAVELRQPSKAVKTRIWVRQLSRHGIEATEAQAQSLAKEYDVNPGVAAGATAAAQLVENAGIDFVRRGTESLARLLHGAQPPKPIATEFDPALISTQFDLERLADSLARRGAQRASLCLSGPPGTGKSATVRFLAERMGLEVEQKRASDLMSMYVGQTERLIADAFAAAREEKQFLVFDEADSLLADRRNAHRSWEISQVNEMLTWMESHPLPFACTTNLIDHLDEATMRRFDFKIELGYLTVEQARAAFSSFFGSVPPAKLDNLSILTPGDFAVVRGRAEILGLLDSPKELVDMLAEECDVKPNATKHIGFSN